MFDEDQTGKISFANLKRVIEMVGEKISDAEIAQMIAEVDVPPRCNPSSLLLLQISPKPSALSSPRS